MGRAATGHLVWMLWIPHASGRQCANYLATSDFELPYDPAEVRSKETFIGNFVTAAMRTWLLEE